jgi:predicted kinase
MAAIVSVLPREGTQLVFLRGLPGSGKTHYAKPLEQQGSSMTIFKAA